jgi:hypothetical protein
MGESLTRPPVPSTPGAEGEAEPEPPYAFIRSQLGRGKVIPFLGAGASLAARPGGEAWKPGAGFLPSGSELAQYLDDRSGYPSGEAMELSRVAQYFDGITGRGGLDSDLHEVFAAKVAPGPLHEFLAELPWLFVVTTNYDDLMEQALTTKGRAYRVVVYRTSDPRFLYWDKDRKEPEEVGAQDLRFDVAEAPVVFKMHGAADRANPERDSYVITEDDYVEFLSRLATTAAIPPLFAESFRKSHFLFLGYGLRDWNLRVVLHRIYQQWPRRFASWAIQQRPDRLEREFWARRQLTIYKLGIDEFLARLQGAPPS